MSLYCIEEWYGRVELPCYEQQFEWQWKRWSIYSVNVVILQLKCISSSHLKFECMLFRAFWLTHGRQSNAFQSSLIFHEFSSICQFLLLWTQRKNCETKKRNQVTMEIIGYTGESKGSHFGWYLCSRETLSREGSKMWLGNIFPCFVCVILSIMYFIALWYVFLIRCIECRLF